MGVEISEDPAKEDCRLTVSQLSPSKECRYRSETSDWNDGGIRPNPAPVSRASIATSPMRPSRKRAASAEQESDGEPVEWEKRWLITESNREGGGEGKQVQEKRGAATGELLVASREETGVASRSLTLTRRLRAKAVRGGHERRVVAARRALGGFPENIGASRTAGEGKGSDRASNGETIGPGMPYNGDNVSVLAFSLVGMEEGVFEI